MNIDAHDRELRLITGLCRELAKLGLNVGMSDARPAVLVRKQGEPVLMITMDGSGGFFEWSEGENRHPAIDMAGAAAAVSEHVKNPQPGPGETS
ncbi:hypothetical protein GCM10023191_073960 [Actinoallomurus oryzae]|uniref:Uncharacterized protein n=1 Tax=Actinoallomurus oryzae TaxID=502180 RepID=A0ABP8QV39_9ACTN